MTLSCNCDMPSDIYADWLQDQGWDCDEFRSPEEVVFTYVWYGTGDGGRYLTGNGGGYGSGTGCGWWDMMGNSVGSKVGDGPTDTGDAT